MRGRKEERQQTRGKEGRDTMHEKIDEGKEKERREGKKVTNEREGREG